MTTKVKKNHAGVSVVTCPQCGTIAASENEETARKMAEAHDSVNHSGTAAFIQKGVFQL